VKNTINVPVYINCTRTNNRIVRTFTFQIE